MNFQFIFIKGRPNIVCKLGINEDNNEVWYQVCDTEGRTYSAYYVRGYGKNSVVTIIDRNIKRQLNKLGAKEIKENKNGRKQSNRNSN